MKILVTGSSGIAGAGFKDIAHEYPHMNSVFCVSRDCDLTDFSATQKYFKKLSPDIVIHLAAEGGGIEMSKKYPATLLRENILMTFSILEAARNTKVKKYF